MKRFLVFECFIWFSAIAVVTSDSVIDKEPKVWNRRRQLRSSKVDTRDSKDYLAEESKKSAPASGKKGTKSSKSGGSTYPGFVFAEQNCTDKSNAENPASPEMGDIAVRNCNLHEVHAVYRYPRPEYTIGDKVGYGITTCTSIDPDENLLDCSFQDILTYGKYMSQEGFLSTLRSDGIFLPDQAFPTVGGTGFFTNLQGVLILEQLDPDGSGTEFVHHYYLDAATKES